MTEIKRVSPEEAKALIDAEGFQYVDVRTEAEFAAGHAPGAHNVPLMFAGPTGMTPNPEFLAVIQKLYAKDAALLLGCKSGNRSLRAAGLLTGTGYTRLADLRSGYEGARNAFGAVTEKGWAASGLPTETLSGGGSYAELLAAEPHPPAA